VTDSRGGATLSDEQIRALDAALGQPRLGLCPIRPNSAKQELFLLTEQTEVFFGGAAGPGKSWGLLMSALQYADVPGYTAILFRPTLTEWHVSGLMTLAQEWLAGTNAVWRGDTNTFYFPGGGRLIFGFAANVQDTFRYRSAVFQFIGWDELTSFTEDVYVRLYGRLRRPSKGSGLAAPDGTRLKDVPLRVRSASNPGGLGHDWVRSRFVNPETRYPSAIFIPARLEDNPDMDTAAYLRSLDYLPPSEKQRLLNGDWDVRDEGELFQYQWFDIVDAWPEGVRSVRYWDLAGTEPSTANSDPDYTVGVKLEIDREGNFIVRDVVRGRWSPGTVQEVVGNTARLDGRLVPVVIEQDPGQAGVDQVDRYKRDVLRGFIAKSKRPTGDKFVRAQPVAAAAENGLLKVVNGKNIREFIDELVAFRPKAPHDDCVDALSGAHSFLAGATVRPLRAGVARGRLPTTADMLYAREMAS
jgi:predicted phage terminase large subunit-like protein